MSRKIYAIESHEQALAIWRDQEIRDARLLHIDFHCDLRGLLVRRNAQLAHKIWTRFPEVDEGNFLKHAVLEGIISGIRWVHDDPGGRRDDIKSVKYESDLSALIHRTVLAIRGDKGIPIEFEEICTSAWTDICADEILDIDWDYFAALEYDPETIQPRIDSFLAQDLSSVPRQTIICYSPEYSHPTRTLFENFVNEMATRFEAEVIEVSRPSKPKRKSRTKLILKPVYQPARQLYHRSCLALRRCGIY